MNDPRTTASMGYIPVVWDLKTSQWHICQRCRVPVISTNLFKETLVMNSQTQFSPQFKRLISDSVNLREIRWRPS